MQALSLLRILIPLLISGRTSLLADMLRMNVQTVASVHTTSGLLIYIQAADHVAVASKVSNFKWENLLDFHGFLVSSDLQKKIYC